MYITKQDKLSYLPVALLSFSSSILKYSSPALTTNSGCTIGLVPMNLSLCSKNINFALSCPEVLFCWFALRYWTLRDYFVPAGIPWAEVTMFPHLVGYVCVHMPVPVYSGQVRLYFVIGPTIDKAKRFNCRPSGPFRTIGHDLLVCRSTYDITSHMTL